MGAIINGQHYDNFGSLPKKEIQISDDTAAEILEGRKSITKNQLLENSLFTKYKDNENFNAMVDMFGAEIDSEELSFLVTALDASKYGQHWNGADTPDGKGKDEYQSQGFYLDNTFGSIDEIMKVTHEDFEQFKQARANANRPEMGVLD